jgi:hypothetical protein
MSEELMLINLQNIPYYFVHLQRIQFLQHNLYTYWVAKMTRIRTVFKYDIILGKIVYLSRKENCGDFIQVSTHTS